MAVDITKTKRRTGYKRLSYKRSTTLIQALERDAKVATLIASGLNNLQIAAQLEITPAQTRRSRERAFERAARAVVIPLAPIVRTELVENHRLAIRELRPLYSDPAMGPAAVSAALKAGQELAKILGLYAQSDGEGEKHLHITIGVPEAERPPGTQSPGTIDSPSVKVLESGTME